MPIIGAAIDFSGQLISGEEVGDATVKLLDTWALV